MNVCNASTYSRKGCDVESGGLNGRLWLYYAARAYRVKSLPAVSFLATKRCDDDDFVIGLRRHQSDKCALLYDTSERSFCQNTQRSAFH
jgi:hypothetical protein